MTPLKFLKVPDAKDIAQEQAFEEEKGMGFLYVFSLHFRFVSGRTFESFGAQSAFLMFSIVRGS